jgi:hypothetical protein
MNPSCAGIEEKDVFYCSECDNVLPIEERSDNFQDGNFICKKCDEEKTFKGVVK